METLCTASGSHCRLVYARLSAITNYHALSHTAEPQLVATAHHLKLLTCAFYILVLCDTTSASMHTDPPAAKQQCFAAHLKLVHLRGALSRCNC
jgi:hypothetical protein